MLSRFHKILLALLAVQIALLVVVHARRDDGAPVQERPILAGFDGAKVTRIQVFGGDSDRPLDLVKRDADWVVASSFDAPVSASRISDLLGAIAKMAAASPIATQQARYAQLRVDDSNFVRKLVFTMGGKDITLLVGGRAGDRQTAVRLAGADRAFGVSGVNVSSIGTDARDWVDSSYVTIPKDEIAKITVKPGIELSRATAPGGGSAAPAETWKLAIDGAPIVLGPGEALDAAAIDRLVGEAATIVLDAPGDPKRDASKPTATITIERKANGASSPPPTIIDVIADDRWYWVHD